MKYIIPECVEVSLHFREATAKGSSRSQRKLSEPKRYVSYCVLSSVPSPSLKPRVIIGLLSSIKKNEN